MRNAAAMRNLPRVAKDRTQHSSSGSRGAAGPAELRVLEPRSRARPSPSPSPQRFPGPPGETPRGSELREGHRVPPDPLHHSPAVRNLWSITHKSRITRCGTWGGGRIFISNVTPQPKKPRFAFSCL